MIAASLLAILGRCEAQYVPADSPDPEKSEAVRFLALRSVLQRDAGRPAIIDVKYYKLDIRVYGNPANVSGSVQTNGVVIVPSTNSVVFDLADTMTVDSVFVDGTASSSVVHSGGTVTITLPRAYAMGETISFRTVYHGAPVTTGFGSFGINFVNPTTPWYWTLSEPYGSRDWWPCIDHQSDKADSLDVWITCAQPLMGVSQGILADSTTNSDGTRTFKWKHRYPIATYLVSIDVTKLNSFTDWYRYAPADSMPVVNYVTDSIGAKNPGYRTAAAFTPAMLGIFSAMFGQYPFIREKYGHAQFGWGGGMEHQTLTSLTAAAFKESVIAHELSHQWFGDMITCRTWPDLWLNEGFASYCEDIYWEKAYSFGTYMSDMMWKMYYSSAAAKLATGSVYLQDTSSVGVMFDTKRVYFKGASVLHMLRHVLGDSVFFASMKTYATDPSLMYGTASSQDFRAACERTSGKSLGYFFDEWIYGENYPTYLYSSTSVPVSGGYETSVRIRQTTGTTNPAFFTMPLDLRLFGAGSDTTVTILNNAADQTFTFPLQTDSVQIDPGNWVLHDAIRSTWTGVTGSMPVQPELDQNFPNPFNGFTTIRYVTTGNNRVTVKVYDILGRIVATLVDGEQAEGAHVVQWRPVDVASGVYFYRMISGAVTFTRSLVVMK